MTCEEVCNKLDPYLDKELPADELANIEFHIRNCAECSTHALGMLQMKNMVRVAASCYNPAPEFRLRLEQSIRPRRKVSWFPISIPKLVPAAALAVLLIGVTVFTVVRTQRERGLTEIADLHVATLASTNPVDVVSSDRHTVKPWFAGKLPFTFNLPELQNSPFALDGGRVTYFQHDSGAHLLFTIRKHYLSVFIFREPQTGLSLFSTTATSTRLAFHIETWSEGGLRYYVISDAPASDVNALSTLLKNANRS